MAATRRPAATAVTVAAKTEAALPEEIKAQLLADVERFKAKLNAPTGNRIGVTQGRQFKMPDGTTGDTIHAVIVDYGAKKAYYPGAFDRDNIVPPTCFAIDPAGTLKPCSLTPSPNSPVIQSEGGCAECERNAWVPLPNNPQKKRKACKDQYVLALLPLDADASTELMTLELSPTAVKDFDAYISRVGKDFGPPYMVATTFVMDPKSEYASVRCINPVKADNSLIMLAYNQREAAVKLLSIEPDVSGYEEAVVEKVKTSTKLVAPRTTRARA